MVKNRIWMISGPSQIGKNTLIQQLNELHACEFITTYTTRLPRIGEIQGQDYYFLQKDNFHKLITEKFFVDWDYTVNNYYGISSTSFVPDENIKIIHVLARMALRLQQKFDYANSIFLYPKDIKSIKTRIMSNFSDPEIIRTRLQHLEEELLHSAMFENIVEVEGGLDATKLVHKIISRYQ